VSDGESGGAGGGAPRVGVLGAGAIGVYVGGLLEEAGAGVVLVGRPGFEAAAARAGGARIADPEGPTRPLRARCTADPGALAACDVALVAVKSTETAAAAETLARVLPPGAVVVSLQNGVRNAGILAAALGAARVHAGMVAFNVVRLDDASFRRTTSGPVRLGGTERIVAMLRGRGLDAALEADMQAVQWAKLIFNTNNAIIALTGCALGDAFLDPDCRAIFRATLREGLAACDAAGIAVKPFGRLDPRRSARLLGLPGFVLKLLLPLMIRVSKSARSSMWEDLSRGRRTEVDLLNGEVTALGGRHGVATPVNAALVSLVKEAEAAGRPPAIAPRDLRTRCGL